MSYIAPLVERLERRGWVFRLLPVDRIDVVWRGGGPAPASDRLLLAGLKLRRLEVLADLRVREAGVDSLSPALGSPAPGVPRCPHIEGDLETLRMRGWRLWIRWGRLMGDCWHRDGERPTDRLRFEDLRREPFQQVRQVLDRWSVEASESDRTRLTTQPPDRDHAAGARR